MICRKITYEGEINLNVAKEIFDVVRKIEIKGEVFKNQDNSVTLLLEGDPSMIKLAQHQIERKAKNSISNKVIESIPFGHYSSLVFKQ